MSDDLDRLTAETSLRGIQCKWEEGAGESGITTEIPTEEKARIIQNIAKKLGFEAEIEKPTSTEGQFHIIVIRSPKPPSTASSHTDATQLNALQKLRSETLIQNNAKLYDALPNEVRVFDRRALPGDFFVIKKPLDSYEIIIRTDKEPTTERLIVTSQENLGEKIEFAKKKPYLNSPLRTQAEKLRNEFDAAHTHCRALDEKDAKETLTAGRTNFCIWPSKTELLGYEFIIRNEKGFSTIQRVLPGDIGLHEQLQKATGLQPSEIDFQWKTGQSSQLAATKFSQLKNTFVRPFPTRANLYANVPGLDEIQYDKKTGYPLFDDKWDNLALEFMGNNSVIFDKKMYLASAQVLLDRLFDKVPGLNDTQNASVKQMYPTLMVMALHLAVKSTEDAAIWNADLHSILKGIHFNTQELNSMERAFLYAIDNEMQVPLLKSIEAILFEEQKGLKEINILLKTMPIGTFILQKTGNQYVLAVFSNIEERKKMPESSELEKTNKEAVVFYSISLNENAVVSVQDKPFILNESGEKKYISPEKNDLERSLVLPKKVTIQNEYMEIKDLLDAAGAIKLLKTAEASKGKEIQPS